MSTVRIMPSGAAGTVTAPPSKSMAHRALICAALAPGESRIEGIAMPEDLQATVSALRSLGARIDFDENEGTAFVRGIDFSTPPESDVIDCRESGSTLRFVIPLCLLRGCRMTLTGSRRLFERPLDGYEEVFIRDGIRCRKTDRSLELEGKLAGGNYTVRGDLSSQFTTGLLLALPMTGEDGTVTVTGKMQSRPYVRMTVEMQKKFGVETEISLSRNGIPMYAVRRDSSYKSTDYRVEGDWTNAAYLDLLNAAGGRLAVNGLQEDSLQGDRIYKEYFDRIRKYVPGRGMEADLSQTVGMPVLDISDCPDLGPALIAAAALCHGAVLTGTARLAVKESDRGRAMAEELAKCGIGVCLREDSIIVPDASLKTPSRTLCGHNDHRIVMALTAVCAVTGGAIEGAEAVKKSFPDYFEKIGKAGIVFQKE